MGKRYLRAADYVPLHKHSRICARCRAVVMLVETDDKEVIEIDLTHRAWALTEARGITGLTVVTQTAAWAVHECPR